MSERDQTPGGPDAPEDFAELANLSEARAARAFAEVLERDGVPAKLHEPPEEEPGAAAGTPKGARGVASAEIDEVLEAAVMIAASRAPELSDEARDRIADALFGRSPVRRQARRWPWLAAAALFLALSGGALWLVERRQAERPVLEAADLRGRAESLLAALLPPGGGPAGRAEAMASLARARIAAEEGTP